MKVKSKSSVKTKVTVKPKSAIKINKKNSSLQVKKAIRQPEERYRTILDETEEAYYELDLAGNFIFMNDATCHHLGYSKEELQGVNFRDHVTKEDFEKVYNYFSNIYKTGKPERAMIYRVKAKDGSIIIVENVGFPLRNQKGEIIGFRGIARDITERKRMEEALRQSEEKYRAIIENIKDGFFEIDLSGKFTFFNEALREIHGYPEKELMGMGNRQYTDKENAKKVFEAFQTIYKTRKAGSIFDYEIIRKDGTKRQVEVSASLKKDASGNPIGFRGVTRDVTERKQAEEAIRQSEARYRTMLDEMDEGYFEVDLAGNYTFVNDANCRHLGYSREELLGLNFRVPMVQKDIEILHKAFANIYLTGEPERGIAYTAVRKNGTDGFAEITGTPLRNQKGEIIGFRGIARDITERKRMEEALRQSEERYRTILDESDVLYYELDLAGNFTFVNDASCRKLGLTREKILGVNSLQHMLKEDVEKIRNYFINIYKTGKPEKSMIYRLKRDDGSIITIENTGFPLRNQKGEIVGFRGVSRDITEQKIMEETLHQSEERYRTILEEMEEAYFEVDLAGNYTYVNDANCRILQYSKEEMLGKSFQLGMSEDDYKSVYNIFSNIYATGKPQKNIIFQGIRKDGTIGFAELTGFPLKNQKGDIIGFRGIGFDITEHKLMEEALRQSEERYRTIIEEMEEWYFESDLTGNMLFFNDAIIRALRYPAKELTGMNFREFVKPEQAGEIYKIFNQVYKTGEPVKNFFQEFVRPDGGITFAEFSIFPKRDHLCNIFGFRCVGHDITERKKTEQQLNYIATHDNLTGLPNRVLFMDRLKIALTHAKRNKHKLAVMMLDLDRFKNINDTLGHVAGDLLLKEMGIRLTGLLRQNDTVSRFGGDEFIVLLPEIVRMEDAREVAEKIIKIIQQPVVFDSYKLDISTSIGIAIYPDDCQDIDSLMKKADMAMYSVKSHGRNGHQFFGNINQ